MYSFGGWGGIRRTEFLMKHGTDAVRKTGILCLQVSEFCRQFRNLGHQGLDLAIHDVKHGIASR